MELRGQWTTYLLCIATFLVLLFSYFYPELQGKEIQKEDHVATKAKAQEVIKHRDKYGEEPLWTNSIFSGMPTFQATINYPSNWVAEVKNKLTKPYMPGSTGLFFTMFLGFFILLLIMKVNPWLAMVGGFAFTFSTYFMTSYEAGHTAKLRVIGFIPFCIATIYLTLRGKWFLGASLTAFMVSAALSSNHPQIVYYLAILIVVIMVVEGISAYRQKKVRPYLLAASLLLIAAFLSVGPNTSQIWGTLQYTEESTRGGGSPLEKAEEGEEASGGLEEDYAMRWSYGKVESFNLMIPGLYGGGTPLNPDKDSHTAKAFKDRGAREGQLDRYLGNLPMYWGPQPMTNAPNYIGAVISFLFILGLFVVKRTVRWWVLAASALSLMMAWGRHLPGFNELLFEHLPFYNKFRAPSMTLTILNFAAPLMAILAVQEIVRNRSEELLKKATWAFYITGGICLFFALFGSSLFDFEGQAQQADQLRQAGFLEPLKKDRASLLQQSSIRSFIFIGLAFFALWAYMKSKIQLKYLIPAIGILVVADLWGENRKYLNDEDWSEPKKPAEYVADCADLKILIGDPSIDCRNINRNSREYKKMMRQLGTDQIYYMKDGEEDHYRVYNMASRNPFNENFTAYSHKSIGGYHAAKLARYQDLIDRHLKNRNRQVLNMLNAKWLIVPQQQGEDQQQSAAGKRLARLNRDALGNAWFVEDLKKASSAEEAISALGRIDPGSTAVYHQEFEPYFEGKGSPGHQEGSRITLEHYKANHLRYKADVQGDKAHFAVFSEIYYDGSGKDWKVRIDGEEVDYTRVNYLLRGLWIPPGEHEIEFEFRPPAFYTGERIALASSVVIFLLIMASSFYEWRNRGKKGSMEAYAVEEDPDGPYPTPTDEEKDDGT